MTSRTAGQTTGAPEIVAKVRQMSDMLRCEALPRGTSQELIMKVAKERWTTLNWRKSSYSSGNGL